jgi:hypothetical protein
MRLRSELWGSLLVALVLGVNGVACGSANADGSGGSVGGAPDKAGGAGPGGGAGGAGTSGGASTGGTSAGGDSNLGGAGSIDNCGEPEACGLVECAPAKLTGDHVATCSPIEPSTNPPTSGPHYPVWAAFGIYDEPIPDGFFIHSLEHSAVALLYDCDAAEQAGLDCNDLRAELETFYAAWPEDPLCSDVPHRLIVAPDPTLGVPFAAAAWGYYMRGNCFDSERVTQFATEHYGKNYENICNSGIDPFDPGCPTE